MKPIRPTGWLGPPPRAFNQKVVIAKPHPFGLSERKVARRDLPEIERASVRKVCAPQDANSTFAFVVAPIAALMVGQQLANELGIPIWWDVAQYRFGAVSNHWCVVAPFV
jgi:hypothetical protein